MPRQAPHRKATAKASTLNLFFVHQGHANYPSIPACMSYLRRKFGYNCQEIRADKLASMQLPPNSVLWYMMGIYRTRNPQALAVIHEYRSASVGKLGILKDWSKRLLNHTPDFRLFHNTDVQNIFDPRDGVPNGILDLGVPMDILKHRSKTKTHRYDFGYVGAINRERGIDKLLHAFTQAYGTRRTLLLIGEPRDGIAEEFKAFPNLVFHGKVKQAEVFPLINTAKIAISYFPYHRPHCYQPPAKLYEYAALGRAVLANDAPSNIAAIKRFGLKAHVMKGMNIPTWDAVKNLSDNMHVNPAEAMWDKVVEDSGVETFLANLKQK